MTETRSLFCGKGQRNSAHLSACFSAEYKLLSHSSIKCKSVQFIHSVGSDSLRPHGLQHARLPCPLPTTKASSNSCPLSRWCHPTISSSVIPFIYCLHLSQDQGLFQGVSSLHQVAKSIEGSASASVLPMNIQYWFLLGLTGLISLQSKGLSRVFSNTTVYQFIGA